MGRGGVATLIGEYQHTLDEKGRLTVPAKFREELGEQFVMTVGLDNCLTCYPQAEWDKVRGQLLKLPMSNREARRFERLLQARGSEVELDRQGRVLLPQNLRAAVGIESEAVLIGLNTRVEIWAEPVWRTYRDEATETFEEIAEKMAEFGL